VGIPLTSAPWKTDGCIENGNPENHKITSAITKGREGEPASYSPDATNAEGIERCQRTGSIFDAGNAAVNPYAAINWGEACVRGFEESASEPASLGKVGFYPRMRSKKMMQETILIKKINSDRTAGSHSAPR
jgi:hypothetical protein